MLASLGLTLVFLLIVALIRSELRSALCGIALSNGVEVLVKQETYEAIVQRFRMLDDADEWERWDQAVLDVLRPDRPYEWKFLVRSLGYYVAAEGLGARRQFQTVNR